MGHCDGCGKDGRKVTSVGRDRDGGPEAPDFCFVCIKEGERGRSFDRKAGCYRPTFAILVDDAKEADRHAARETAKIATEEDDLPF